MLVLSRQRDETIMIGDEIEISIVDIRGDKVRLGITAPSKIAVHRKEVYQAIRAENEQAAHLQGADFTLPPTAGIAPGPARSKITGVRVLAPPPGTQVAARLSPRATVPATSIPPTGPSLRRTTRS